MLKYVKHCKIMQPSIYYLTQIYTYPGHGGGSIIFGQLVSRIGTSGTFQVASLTSVAIIVIFLTLNKVINKFSAKSG